MSRWDAGPSERESSDALANYLTARNPHLRYASSAAGVSPNRGDRGHLNLMPSGLVLKALNTWPNGGEYVAEWGVDQGILLP